MLLQTAYFPPVEYFALLARDMTLSPDRVIPSHASIEAMETYRKQSYRNRCYILGPQGREMLQVPVVHSEDMSIRSVRIEYTTPWVVRTERAIDAAYKSSAWFDEYREPLFAILDAREEHLFDLNLSLIRFFLAKTGIDCRLEETTSFRRTAPDDFREAIHPKKDNAILRNLGLERPYYQVFSEKYGFTPNLSVMDLLFNEGPDSILWLKSLRQITWGQ